MRDRHSRSHIFSAYNHGQKYCGRLVLKKESSLFCLISLLPPYSLLGYNRAITRTNIDVLLSIGPGAGGGKRKVKSSSLPNTFDGNNCSLLTAAFFFRVLCAMMPSPWCFVLNALSARWTVNWRQLESEDASCAFYMPFATYAEF